MSDTVNLPVSSLDLAHLAENYELEHDFSYSRITGDAKCRICNTMGIGDPDDKCDGPEVYGMWWGGPSYSQPYVSDDVELFTGLRHAKECFEERFNASRIAAMFHPVAGKSHLDHLDAVSGSTMTLWFYDPTDEHDPYPDLLLKQDDNDEITEELT